ncbi:uncharacterized protein C9orf43 homolog isoform X2 [Octodon degus]|uniref:Uncharacterized protein C9orf43 homolog isoform X2 n=1 Tax=Octodon degus TaxID=10160 RepID=A0A6P6F493_OCTDE|nr:uncharacterized protein C9orf43 homolog isoform X2 [Octodon degus]
MILPDDSQWDETICDLAVCPHPQCWAAVRRIERGHPRILSLPCKTALDAEGQDTCSPAVTRICLHYSSFLIVSRLKACLQIARAQKDSPKKTLISCPKRSPKESHKKLSVLNLNETQLPCSEDVRNMVVIWIPEESKKNVCLPKKTSLPSQYEKKKKELLGKTGASLCSPERRQFTEAESRTAEGLVPSSSPVLLTSEQLSSAVPVWAHDNMLPQDLLKELLLHGEKNMPCSEMKIQLDRMKKSLPLEKTQPDSEISSKMFLTIHRLTLQRPVLRYPEHLKKKEGYRKQQQWQQPQERKEKTSTQEQEAKKKAKNDQWIQSTPHKHSREMLEASACSPIHGHRILSDQESDMQPQQQQMKTEVATLKQVSMERSRKDHSDKSLSFFPDMKSSKMSTMELPCKDVGASVETVLEVPVVSQEITGDPPESGAKISWKPELKLLRILQATDVEEDQPTSGSESEDSWDT